MKITRKQVKEAIARLRKGGVTTNSEMNTLMNEVLKHRCEMQTIKEWEDAAYYMIHETRKETVEKEAKELLYKVIKERCGGHCKNPGDYIQEFFWDGNCLYASIDRLQNPKMIATLKKGVLV